MTLFELIAELQDLRDRQYGHDVPVIVEIDGRDKEVTKAEFHDGYDESANGGGWNVCRVVLNID